MRGGCCCCKRTQAWDEGVMGRNPAVPGRVTQQTSSDSSENTKQMLEEDLGWCGVVLGLVVRIAGETGMVVSVWGVVRKGAEDIARHRGILRYLGILRYQNIPRYGGIPRYRGPPPNLGIPRYRGIPRHRVIPR